MPPTQAALPDARLNEAAATTEQTQVEFFTSVPVTVTSQASVAAAPAPTGPRYELNFNDAEVRSVVDAVLGDMLKMDYVVSPSVQGKITFRTSKPVHKTALLPALEAALASASVVLVKGERLIQVMTAEEAPLRVRSAEQAARNGPRTPGYAVEIIPLRYISATEMKTILDAFLPKGTVLQADNNNRHIVVAGSSQERASVMRTVSNFDVDWLQGMNFAIFRLSNVRPEVLASEMRSVLQGSLDLLSQRVRLVPLERTQSLLAMARERPDLDIASEWIRRLDSNRSSDRRVFVYNVQNGRAKDLVAALRQVMGEASSPERQEREGPQTTAGASQTSNIAQTSSPPNQTRLVAVEENNSILFHGTEAEYRIIREALVHIDTTPRQVMIEAILAEVTLNDNLRYGVQWFFDSGENTITLSTSDAGSVASQFPGFSYVYSGKADARVVLNALQSKTDVRILSAPKLAVLNNQKASLQVGDQVPIVTQTSQGTVAPGAPIVSTIQMRDTGVILQVTPRVNESGNIVLEVLQEVSEVSQTTSSGIDSPTIQTRKIHSTVATRDGYTVALGGLIRESGAKGNSGVPLLKDIPGVGNLFKSTTYDSRRTELIVLLVPHVMRNQTETQMVVDALIDGVQQAAELAERANPLSPGPKP